MDIQTENILMADPEIPIKTDIVSRYGVGNLNSSLHSHAEIELLYVLTGEMHFFVAGETVPVKKGQIIILNSFTPHSTTDIGKETTRICLLQFQPIMLYQPTFASEYKYVLPFMNTSDFKYCVIGRGDEQHANLSGALIMIEREFTEKHLAYEIVIKSLLYQMLALLFRCRVLDYSQNLQLVQNNDSMKKIADVLKYVDENYSSEIKIEKVTALINYSYHYFCKIFKRATGKPFIQYVNFVRINQAEKLLLTTDMPISEIVARTGFSSFSYFNRVFNKLRGESPTVYRANHNATTSQAL